MKEKVICYIMIHGCYGLFWSLEFLRFLSVLYKFAEKSDGERVNKVSTTEPSSVIVQLSINFQKISSVHFRVEIPGSFIFEMCLHSVHFRVEIPGSFIFEMCLHSVHFRVEIPGSFIFEICLQKSQYYPLGESIFMNIVNLFDPE